MASLRSLCELPPALRQVVFRQLRVKPVVRSPVRLTKRNASTTSPAQPRPDEPLVPPPSPTSGPLMSRMPNRALPNLSPGMSSATKQWLVTMPIFLTICALGSLSIFNYQKSSSSTVSSILYALRTSPAVRDMLGDEIYFASRIPWISGELNQLHGRIDISFWVKGTKRQGLVRFISVRPKRDGYFETMEWSLTTKNGNGEEEVVHLLELEGRDPMSGTRTQQAIQVLDEAGEL